MIISDKKYFFHFRENEMPLLFIDIALNHSGYGCFDYRILQQQDDMTGFLTKRGIRQAAAFGVRMLDKNYNTAVLGRFRTIVNILKRTGIVRRVPADDTDELMKIWRSARKITIDFSSMYRYCEQPMQSALEEIVFRAAHKDNDTLAAVFSNPDAARKLRFTDEQRLALDILIQLGKFKLLYHELYEPWLRAITRLVEIIAQKNDMAFSQTSMIRNHEFSKALRGKLPPLDLLNARSKGCVFLPSSTSKRWRCEHGATFTRWKKILLGSLGGAIKGMPAYPGKVRGAVVKHLSWHGITAVSRNSILVTGMTNPQMVPFLKNVSAIVTDEGGLTCHAAIISREFRIPCIVDTGNATQLLNDGDMVEVDANKGIVRKIS